MALPFKPPDIDYLNQIVQGVKGLPKSLGELGRGIKELPERAGYQYRIAKEDERRTPLAAESILATIPWFRPSASELYTDEEGILRVGEYQPLRPEEKLTVGEIVSAPEKFIRGEKSRTTEAIANDISDTLMANMIGGVPFNQMPQEALTLAQRAGETAKGMVATAGIIGFLNRAYGEDTDASELLTYMMIGGPLAAMRGRPQTIYAPPAPKVTNTQRIAAKNTLIKKYGFHKNDFKSQQAITNKYRQQAMRYHPDRGGSHEDMKALNNNYEMVKGLKVPEGMSLPNLWRWATNTAKREQTAPSRNIDPEARALPAGKVPPGKPGAKPVVKAALATPAETARQIPGITDQPSITVAIAKVTPEQARQLLNTDAKTFDELKADFTPLIIRANREPEAVAQELGFVGVEREELVALLNRARGQVLKEIDPSLVNRKVQKPKVNSLEVQKRMDKARRENATMAKMYQFAPGRAPKPGDPFYRLSTQPVETRVSHILRQEIEAGRKYTTKAHIMDIAHQRGLSGGRREVFEKVMDAYPDHGKFLLKDVVKDMNALAIPLKLTILKDPNWQSVGTENAGGKYYGGYNVFNYESPLPHRVSTHWSSGQDVTGLVVSNDVFHNRGAFASNVPGTVVYTGKDGGKFEEMANVDPTAKGLTWDDWEAQSDIFGGKRDQYLPEFKVNTERVEALQSNIKTNEVFARRERQKLDDYIAMKDMFLRKNFLGKEKWDMRQGLSDNVKRYVLDELNNTVPKGVTRIDLDDPELTVSTIGDVNYLDEEGPMTKEIWQNLERYYQERYLDRVRRHLAFAWGKKYGVDNLSIESTNQNPTLIIDPNLYWRASEKVNARVRSMEIGERVGARTKEVSDRAQKETFKKEMARRIDEKIKHRRKEHERSQRIVDQASRELATIINKESKLAKELQLRALGSNWHRVLAREMLARNAEIGVEYVRIPDPETLFRIEWGENWWRKTNQFDRIFIDNVGDKYIPHDKQPGSAFTDRTSEDKKTGDFDEWTVVSRGKQKGMDGTVINNDAVYRRESPQGMLSSVAQKRRDELYDSFEGAPTETKTAFVQWVKKNKIWFFTEISRRQPDHPLQKTIPKPGGYDTQDEGIMARINEPIEPVVTGIFEQDNMKRANEMFLRLNKGKGEVNMVIEERASEGSNYEPLEDTRVITKDSEVMRTTFNRQPYSHFRQYNAGEEYLTPGVFPRRMVRMEYTPETPVDVPPATTAGRETPMQRYERRIKAQKKAAEEYDKAEFKRFNKAPVAYLRDNAELFKWRTDLFSEFLNDWLHAKYEPLKSQERIKALATEYLKTIKLQDKPTNAEFKVITIPKDDYDRERKIVLVIDKDKAEYKKMPFAADLPEIPEYPDPVDIRWRLGPMAKGVLENLEQYHKDVADLAGKVKTEHIRQEPEGENPKGLGWTEYKASPNWKKIPRLAFGSFLLFMLGKSAYEEVDERRRNNQQAGLPARPPMLQST